MNQAHFEYVLQEVDELYGTGEYPPNDNYEAYLTEPMPDDATQVKIFAASVTKVLESFPKGF